MGEMSKKKMKKVGPKTKSAGGKSKKTKDLGAGLAELHPKFLDALRDTQPLTYLASFMLLIAIFSTGEFIGARSYAIGSAFVFLIAFICSLYHKITPTPMVAISSYTATGTGIFLLILVIAEFSKTIPLAGTAIYFSFATGFIITISPVLYYIRKLLREDLKKEVKQRHILVLGDTFLFIGFGLLITSSLIVAIGHVAGISSLENISMNPFRLSMVFILIGFFARFFLQKRVVTLKK